MSEELHTGSAEQAAELPTLRTPERPPIKVADARSWQAMVKAVANGSGPVGLDVERAQSFRYSGKAYLVQLKRNDDLFLIDPIAFESPAGEIADFSELNEAIGDAEWILHAASQDLPNLVSLKMAPQNLFDTELAGRLLGLPRVGLGPIVERYCGVHLLKEHSMADWSTRPMPGDWLDYAALDVELLVPLRDAIAAELTAAGKEEWARQEFAHLVEHATDEKPIREEPWRRTHGLAQVTSARGMALVRELWTTRDELARAADRSPSKILQDKAITELASIVNKRHPGLPSMIELRKVEGFRRREARRHEADWERAIMAVSELPKAELPDVKVRRDGIPKHHSWDRINPEAAARWELVRPVVVEKADELNVPVENLISPDALHQLLWNPQGVDEASLDTQLRAAGARAWQREIVVPLAAAALAKKA